jgi:hypothetical protein
MYYICLMSEPAVAIDNASAQVGSHYGVALETLGSTVKWLVAAAGAVVAAIVAGAQIVDYSKRNLLGAGLAALAVVIALSLTIFLLVRAAKILTVPRPTVIDLANAELPSGALDPRLRQSGQVSDPNIVWLLGRKPYLLGPYDTVTDLLKAYDSAATQVHDNARDENAQRSLSDLRQRIGTVEEAAHYRDMSNAYNKLLREFRKGAAWFIAAVVVFSVSGLLGKDAPEKPSNPVTKPIPVRVLVTDTLRPTPAPCRDRGGVAVGGTLTSPTVVMPPAGECAAATLTPQQPGAVVIPQLPSGGTGG